jgi:DNA-binding response OmpR family regulator
METILIVEDDPAMLRGLKDNFEFAGYHVLTADEGEAGLNAALNARPDLILLDIMLPKINGYEVCRLIRKQKLDMPIIMLTAKGEESDVVLGLNLGADDYVTKPFSIKELLARVEALRRRTRTAEPEVFRFAHFVLDLAARRVTRMGEGAKGRKGETEEIRLSPKEFKLLEMFVKKPGRALSRDDILNLVWGYDSFTGPRTVDRFVTTLRNKIEPDPPNPVYIHTIRELGYKFDPPQ